MWDIYVKNIKAPEWYNFPNLHLEVDEPIDLELISFIIKYFDNKGIKFYNFEFEKMSIAFNVNENLSISWGELDETYDAQSNVKGGTEIADVEMSSTSIQFAYTMGSMSIKGYQTDTDNPGWDSNAKSDTVTELAVNFAF